MFRKDIKVWFEYFYAGLYAALLALYPLLLTNQVPSLLQWLGALAVGIHAVCQLSKQPPHET